MDVTLRILVTQQRGRAATDIIIITNEYPRECKLSLSMTLPSSHPLVLPSSVSRARVHFEMPQTSGRPTICPRLAANVEQCARFEAPVLGLTPSGIRDCAEVSLGGRIEGVRLVRRFFASGERDRIIAGLGRNGRRDAEDRWFVGSLVFEGDFGEVECSVHEMSGGRF